MNERYRPDPFINYCPYVGIIVLLVVAITVVMMFFPTSL